MTSTRLIYFSPTGTTRRVLDGIAGGLDTGAVEHLDLTPVDKRGGPVREIENALTVIGTPVYTGRVPLQAVEALRLIRAEGAPAILVVVYGNRAYEDALLELRNTAAEAGFIPVAGAAFVGEHSFSTVANPIARGRPDDEDLARAREFGRMIRERTGAARWLENVPPLPVPGSYPYRERNPRKGSPATSAALCTRCGNCSEACPEGAVTVEDDGVVTDEGKCLLCCACVRRCPTGARRLDDPVLVERAAQLAAACRERRQPEFFLPWKGATLAAV